MSGLKDTAEAADAWINLALKFAGPVALTLLFFFPFWAPILNRFVITSSEINILGQKLQVADTTLFGSAVKIEAGKLIVSGMDVNTIPDTIAKLNQSIKDLSGQNAALTENLQNVQSLLDQATKQRDDFKTVANATASAPAPEGSPAPAVTEALNTAIDKSKADLRTQVAASALTTMHAVKLVKETAPAPAPGFGIVVGDFDSTQSAEGDAQKIAKVSESGSPSIPYKRQGRWLAVAYFGVRAEAMKELPDFKKEWPQAYFVDISTWCPTPIYLSAPAAGKADSPPAQKDCGF